MEQFLLDNSWVFIPLLIWSLIWKGIALWKSARREDKVWFVAFMILNTLGLLEILYIFVIAKPKAEK